MGAQPQVQSIPISASSTGQHPDFFTNTIFFNPYLIIKMKSVVALSALAAIASAHYTFDVLVINGQQSAGWQYIRENTRAEKYMPTKFINSPSITPLDNDFRCNEGSFTNAGKTQVAAVAAGSELSMKLAYGATMQHPVSHPLQYWAP